MLLVAGSLIARTISDIYLIQAVTEVESAIVSMNRAEFKTSILKYSAPLPLVSYIECWSYFGMRAQVIRISSDQYTRLPS